LDAGQAREKGIGRRGRMSTSERALLAVAIVVVDVAVVVIPVTALAVAWVVLARPPWFREWVERLYARG
jgi:hypothetical protein